MKPDKKSLRRQRLKQVITAMKKPLKLMEVLHLVKFVFVLVCMRVFCLQDDKVEKACDTISVFFFLRYNLLSLN